ncbi:MAG: hypothetical protein E7773_12110 [Sphingomonas sp.]|uniref:hypothetical protein n=1 Tax=Sphingomonas sp. TaxID=28214 RepID=UPI001203721C|nr:hypothetical protein [Sphingomonas sp.]THD35190.1 MAG: hypothetical protein E7773_12110 [Sphingomonas sp.]
MKYGIALFAVMAPILGAPAFAQQKASMDGEKVLAKFAQCAVRAAPREAAMVIDTAPDSAAEQAQLDLLFKKHGNCFQFGPTLAADELSAEVALGRLSVAQAAGQLAGQRQQVAFPRRALRGAIATRLYLDLAKASPPASPVPAPALGNAGLPPGYVVVRCAAALDPVIADRLVRSKRLSTTEAEAGRAFAPVLNGCARGMGRIDMTGTAIHGWAAEALYLQRRPAVAEGR